MRLKKNVLLYCADPESLAATVFELRRHAYEVIAIESCADAALLAGDTGALFACCVVIHAQQGDMAGRLIYRLLEVTAHVPILLIDRVGDLAPVRYADAVLYGRNTSLPHILASLDALCYRERRSRSRARSFA